MVDFFYRGEVGSESPAGYGNYLPAP